MISPLFDNLTFIAESLAASAHVLIGLDYDGTLTPIVEDPSRAWLRSDVRSTVRNLSQLPATTVAVISGRTLDDIRTRVGLGAVTYAGNHGLEIDGPGLRFSNAEALRRRDELNRLSQELAAGVAAIPGAFVEDKRLSLSVHFRQVALAQHGQVRRIVEAEVAKANDRFAVRWGNLVCEVLPMVGWNKGAAACWIKGMLDVRDARVLYLGDDVTDEDAFLALREHITVKVGDPSSSSARYHLAGPEEVRTFLEWLLWVRGLGSH